MIDGVTPLVRIHCGSAHVQGSARKWRYVVASLFVPHRCRDGRIVYRNSITWGPWRGDGIAERSAREMAQKYGAVVLPGYGSLHNRPAQPIES